MVNNKNKTLNKDTLYKRRLLRLARHLINGILGHKKFNFFTWNEGSNAPNVCGTAGCAVGECPIVFPRSWKFADYEPIINGMKWDSNSYYDMPFNSAMEFFGLTAPEASHLFVPEEQDVDEYGGTFLYRNASAKQVGENMLIFIDKKYPRKAR